MGEGERLMIEDLSAKILDVHQSKFKYYFDYNQVQYTKGFKKYQIQLCCNIIIMLRVLLNTGRLYARTRKPTQIDIEKMEQFRDSMLQNLPSFYTTSDRPHDDRVYEEKLYGRKCNIVGMTPDSLNSATFIKSALTKLNPDLVILGGFNSSRLLSERIANTIAEKRLVRKLDSVIEPAKLYCKSLVTPMVTKIIEQDRSHVINRDSETVFRVDHAHKRIEALNYMTIMNQMLPRQFCKLSFGMPSDYILFEDIMINQSITELRQLFERVMQVTELNKNEYGEATNSFNYYLTHIIGEARYHAVLEPLLHKKQLTYTTALLHKSVSVNERVVLFVENQFVHQISENVHKITVDPKQVYRGGQSSLDQFINLENSEASSKLRGYLTAFDKSETISEVLEKLVILSILKNQAMEQQLLNDNQNIFKNTAFSSLFNDVPLPQTQQRYRAIKQKYDNRIGQIMKKRIRNITQFREPQKNFYTLTQMIKTQQQRNQDFPVHLIPRNRATENQARIDKSDIHKEIDSMVRNELTQTERELIDFHRSKQMTRESIVLYQKLLVEAKLRLKKSDFKLPVYHFGGMSALFKDQMKTSMLSRSKSNKNMLLESIQKLKQEGLVREIESAEEFEKLTNGQTPDIAVDMDEKTGELKVREEATGNSEEKIQKLLKSDILFQQMYELTEASKQEETKDINEQYDERHRPMQMKRATKVNDALTNNQGSNKNRNNQGKQAGRRTK